MKKTPFLIAATLLVVLILGLLFLHPFRSNQAAGTAAVQSIRTGQPANPCTRR